MPKSKQSSAKPMTSRRQRRRDRGRSYGTSRAGRNDNFGGSGIVSASRVPNTEIIERSIPLFAARTTKHLRYSTNLQLVSTAGAVASYVFAANGLYDPDITGVGHQPMGFDEMMLYYNHYTVTHANFQVVAKGVSASKMTICLRQDASSTPITVIDRIVELGGAVYDYLEVTSSFGATKRVQMALDIAKIQGISRTALTADSSLRGTSAANPSELTYAHVQLWDSAAQSGTVNFDVVIDFIAIFTEPRDITTSVREMVDRLVLQETKLPPLVDDVVVVRPACTRCTGVAGH